MFIAVADSSIFCNQFFSFMSCRMYIPQVMCWTMFFKPSTYKCQDRAIKMIFVSSNFWEVFWIMVTLQLNICLCVDLVLMIKYPFQDKQSRMKYYLTSAVVIPFIIGMLNVFYLNQGQTLRWPYILYSVWFSCFMIAAFYSTIYAGSKLIRPGISG